MISRHLALSVVICALYVPLLLAQKHDAGVANIASQSYPGYKLLLLRSTRTSSINAAVRQAVQEAQISTPVASFLVVLEGEGSSNRNVLTVDVPVTVDEGVNLVITTPGALRAAAAAAEAQQSASGTPGPAVQQFVAVICSSSRADGFLDASGAGDIVLSGLSIRGCPGHAIKVQGSRRLIITDTQLINNNQLLQLQDGGAIWAANLQQVTLTRVLCSSNYALTKGGCLYASDLSQGLVLTHSQILYNWKDDPDNGGGGSGVYVRNSHSFSVSHCDVSHNTALGIGSFGGGLCAQLVDVMMVDNCKFVNNSAAMEGGGFSAWDVGELVVRDSNFTDNGVLPPDPSLVDYYYTEELQHTLSGAALSMVGSRETATYAINATLERLRFIGNEADAGGAVVASQWGVSRGRLEVTDCLLVNNKGYLEAGGIYYNENFASDIIVRRSKFTGNFGQYGGALSFYDSAILVEDCDFEDNWSESDGGGIHMAVIMGATSGNKLTVVRSNFKNNTSGSMGGGVAVDGASLAVYDCVLDSNKALFDGGGVSVASGGVAYISGSVFRGNTAEQQGGAIGLREVGVVMVNNTVITNNTGLLGGGISLVQVGSASLSDLLLVSNTAQQAGGAAVLLQGGEINWSNSNISSNKAQMGGGVAADSSIINMQQLVISGNVAGVGQKATSVAEQDAVRQFASLVYISGTAGGALLQRSSITLKDCVINNNAADVDAGALLMQQPAAVEVVNSSFVSNTAHEGVGGGLVIRGTGMAAAVNMRECRFRANLAEQGSGGALLVDSGLGVIELACDGCEFGDNDAGQDGGGIAAAGPTTFNCTSCQSTNNSAGGSGGWFHCGGCSTATVTQGSSSGNKAAASGGSISCDGCGTFSTDNNQFVANMAAAGGAVAVQSGMSVNVGGCQFDQNDATAAQQSVAATGVSRQLLLMDELPVTWQMLYGVGSAAAAVSVGCSSGGAGGGLCVSGAGEAQLTDLTLTDNTGSTGGAVFAAAACYNGVETASGCHIDLVNLTAIGNTATAAGGALYSSTPQAIQLSGVQPESSDHKDLQQSILLQQLMRDNTVAAGGYGPGAASYPARLSLIDPTLMFSNPTGSDVSSSKHQRKLLQNSDADAEVSGPSVCGDGAVGCGAAGSASAFTMMVAHGRRLYQLMPRSSGGELQDTLASISRNIVNRPSSAEDASLGAGVELDPTCPALGATVLSPAHVGVDSFQIFSLPVYILDAFGSRVSSGPGADWLVSLSQPWSSTAQLSGAARGRLSSGYTLMDGLTLSAPSGNTYNITLAAIRGQGIGGQPLNTSLTVEVRPCLPGQRAEYANGTSAVTESGAAVPSSSSTQISCTICPAPSFSFSAYGDTAAAAAGTCPACPARGICVAGMVIPAQGCYQAHPRSATIKACPHTRACVRDINAMQNLQGLQCSYRAYLDPQDIDPRPFQALQCSRGYAGPLCSACYRPGRNAWIGQQWQQQQLAQQQQQQQRGYTVAGQPPVLAKPWSDFNPMDSFGQRNGRCSSCPHPALAWLGFVMARVVDLLLVGLLAVLWMLFGWLATSPAAPALDALKETKSKDLRLGLISFNGSLASYKRSQQQQQQKLGSGDSDVGKPTLKSLDEDSSQHSAGKATPAVLRVFSNGNSGGPGLLPPAVQSAAHHSYSTAEPGYDIADDHTGVSPFAFTRRASSRFGLGLFSPLASIRSASGSARSGSVTSLTPSGAARAGSTTSAASSRLPPVSSQGGLMGRSLAGFYNVSAAPSMRWSSAMNLINNLQHTPQTGIATADKGDAEGPADMEATLQWSALLLMAFRHLACLVQVVLDAAQVAAVLLSLDLVYFIPDWAATGLSAVLVTQYNTWQWMSVDCLIPADSEVSPAVLEAVMIIFMPVIYICILFPVLAVLKRNVSRYFGSISSTAPDRGPGQQHLQPGKGTAPVGSGVSVFTSPVSSGRVSGSVIAAAHSAEQHLPLLHPVASDLSGAEPIECSPFAIAAADQLYGQRQHAAAPQGVTDSRSSSTGDAGGAHGPTNTGIVAGDSCCITFKSSASTTHQQHSGMTSLGSFSLPTVISNLCSSGSGHSSSSSSKAHNGYASQLLALLDGCWPLLASVFTASMSYCFALYVHMLVSSFSCMALAGAPSLPGEIHLTGRYWVSDMQQQCWGGPHLAVVLLSLMVAVPLLLGYWFLLLLLAWPQVEPQEYEADTDQNAAMAPSAFAFPPAVPGNASLPATNSADPGVSRVHSYSSSSAAAAAAAASGGDVSAAETPKLFVDIESSELPDHLDMDHLGPFAAAAAAADAHTSTGSERSDSFTQAGVAGGNNLQSSPFETKRSMSVPATSTVEEATSVAAARDQDHKHRLTPTPSGLISQMQSPFGLASSQSVVLQQQPATQHSELSSTAAAGMIWQTHSHSSTGSSHHYHQQQHPELIESASGQMLLQTQFGLVPAGSGLVETPLGLKHTRSGRWCYSPAGGLTSPHRSGPPVETIPGPALQRGHSLTSGLSAPVTNLAQLGPVRIMETRSGPVVVPAAAAAAATGVPTAVPMAVQAAVPVQGAGAGPSTTSSSSSSSHGDSDQPKETGLLGFFSHWLRTLFSWLVRIPARMLEPPVRYCQQHYTLPAQVTGEACAGLGVWNDRCWYWMPVKEIVKFVLVAAAAATTLRGLQVQALVMLLLVIVAAAVSWRVQAGCNTSMNRLLYIAYCWLQLLCLLVLLMTLQGISAAAYGGVVLGLLVVVVGQCWLLLGGLSARCVVTGKELGELGLETLQQHHSHQHQLQEQARQSIGCGLKQAQPM